MTLDDLIALEKRMTAKPWSSTKHNTRFWVGDVGDPRVNNSCDQCVSDLKGVATFRNVLPELLEMAKYGLIYHIECPPTQETGDKFRDAWFSLNEKLEKSD